MKKAFILAAGTLLCALSLVSCKSNPVYKKGYLYEVVLNVNYGKAEDVNKVGQELKAVVGDDGSPVRAVLNAPADDKMKNGCAAIQQKYAAGGLNSVYFSFILRKTTTDPDPASAHPKVVEDLAEYAFGDALKNAYAFYSYGSDVEDAKTKLKEMKSQLSDDDYKACGQTLIGVETAFKNLFQPFMYDPYFVSADNDNAIKTAADKLYTEYTAKKNAVIFTYVIGRKDLLSGETVELWKKAFPVNL